MANDNKSVEYAALYDTDKTVIEMTALVNEAMSIVLESECGVSGTLEDLTRDQFAGKNMSTIFATILDLKGVKTSDDQIARLRTSYAARLAEVVHAERFPSTLVCEGVYEFLSNLKGNNVALGIFTGGLSRVHSAVLKATNLEGFFDVRCTSDDDRAKSKRDLRRINFITLCMERLKQQGVRVRPENVIVFGDTPEDIRAAQEYGAKSVGIAQYSLYSREELEAFKPTAVYQSFKKDQYAILSQMFGIERRQR